MERVQGIPWYGKSVALITDLNFNKVPNTAGQGFRIITTAILYRGNLLVCCTGVAYGAAAFFCFYDIRKVNLPQNIQDNFS